MEKHIVDEKTGINYTLQGDYYYERREYNFSYRSGNRAFSIYTKALDYNCEQ